MNATTKFYTGFFIALAVVIAVSFAVGHHFAKSAADPRGSRIAAYRSCLRAAKTEAIAVRGAPQQKLLSFELASSDCAKRQDLPFMSPSDFYDITGVRMTPPDFTYNDPRFAHPDVPRHPRSQTDSPSGLR